MRDPHVQWCERRTPSVLAGGAVYSIGGSKNPQNCYKHKILLTHKTV
jgi:hypothetical protein